MKDKFIQNAAFYDKIQQRKALIYTILAVFSFFAMLFFCIRLKGEGIPLIVCLTLHTCALLLLYRDALIAADPEGWKTEQEWMQEDLPPEEHNLPDTPPEPSPENKILYKRIYAEVKESLIDGIADRQPEEACSAEEISDAPAEAADPLPEEREEPAEAVSVSSAAAPTAFLSAPKKMVEMDLIAAARDAMASLTSFADAQKIKLHLSTTCDTLPMLADPESIRILFRNVIDNSIKYMGRPGHMIITISLLGDDIFLILKDTGNGLAEEETTHVFELNFQGSNRVSGNGLGLTQTKMIVEAFGGTIYAKSSPGNGMAIYIQLPLHHS